MQGPINMDGNRILTLPEPVSDNEPATKSYVDDANEGTDLRIRDLSGRLLTTGNGTVYLLATEVDYAAFDPEMAIVARFHATNEAGATINIDELGALPLRQKLNTALPAGVIVEGMPYKLTYRAPVPPAVVGEILINSNLGLADEEVVAAKLAPNSVTSPKLATEVLTAKHYAELGLGLSLLGGRINASVAANALTVSIKTNDDEVPSADKPVLAVFRNATAGNGSYSLRKVTAAEELVISEGSTFGVSDGEPFRLWIIAFDAAGGIVKLGLSNRSTANGISSIDTSGLLSSVAEGGIGAADSADVIYSSAAIASRPIAVLGYLEWSDGLAAAGQWSAIPTKIQLFHNGVQLPSTILQTHQAVKTDTATGSDTAEDITGLAIALTPKSKVNKVLLQAMLYASSDANHGPRFVFRRDGANVVAGATAGSRVSMHGEVYTEPGVMVPVAMAYLDSPKVVTAINYGIRWQAFATSISQLNRSHTDTDAATSTRGVSTFLAQEIQG